MKVLYPYPGIIQLHFNTQYELTSHFVRIGEFYESPFSGIRHSKFELEDFMDKYAKKTGGMTYFTDWKGYNVPGDIVELFFERYKYWEFREKELTVLDALEAYVPYTEGEPFYLIGTYSKEDATPHEVCHAFYYLDKHYKKVADALVSDFRRNVPIGYKIIKDWLLKEGYSKPVLNDEINAYMATSGKGYLTRRIKLGELWKHCKPFEEAFKHKVKDEQEKVRAKKFLA